MTHYASRDFWSCYGRLPEAIRRQADQAFARLKADPRHPGLHFKKLADRYWSARIGAHHRALAVEVTGGLVWFWIGSHADYDQLVG